MAGSIQATTVPRDVKEPVAPSTPWYSTPWYLSTHPRHHHIAGILFAQRTQVWLLILLLILLLRTCKRIQIFKKIHKYPGAIIMFLEFPL